MLVRIWKSSTKKINMVYNRLFYNLCYLCTQPCLSWFCDTCFGDLPRLKQPCIKCGQPNQPSGVCGHCLNHPPPYERLWIPFEYRTPVDQLIRRWKDHHQPLPPIYEPLLALFSDHNYDIIAPIPSHWRRRLVKGHHPPRQLAKRLARKHPNNPIVLNLLRRNKPTTSQRGLDKHQRQKNLKQAFKALKPHLIRGKNILLVDDVFTTGATASSASKALVACGAKSVSIACIARTPEYGGN